MLRDVKVGFIGCGGIANGKHLKALEKLPYVKIVAFCDLIEERAVKAKEQYGTPDAKVYTDYTELLKDKDIEVIHVCTPNKSHAPISIAAMRAGKHVMCEKPMAKTFAEAQEMVKVSKETGMKLTIGYQNRYRADSQHLHQMCERGDLGEIYFAKAHAIRRAGVPTWGVFINEEEQGGGPLIDIGTHALDLTLWMMNNYKPKTVMGSVFKKLNDKFNMGNSFGAWDPEINTVEDSAFGFIQMEDGATIVLESSWALNTLEVGEAQTTLCGTEMGADMKDGLRICTSDLGRRVTVLPDLSAKGVDFFDGVKESSGDKEARLWYDAIINDTEPVVKPEEAMVVTQILEAIYESGRTGKPVTFK